MSSPSLTGYSPNNPRKYLGPNVGVSTVVVRNRAPTGADIKQPNTGKYYPFCSFWLVGETSPGVEPITGARGDLWYLEYIEANVAMWVQVSTDILPTQDVEVQAAVSPGVNPVTVSGAGLINVNAFPVANAGIPTQSITRALNTYNIETQYAGSSASSTANLSGLAHFNQNQFTVDANGFVQIIGGLPAIEEVTANTGFAAPVAGNVNFIGLGETKTTGSGSTVSIFSPSTAAIIVDPTANNGNYQTIGAALAAATAGQTIFIRPGVYTENITLKPNVNLSAYSCDAYGGATTGVRIVGMCTYNGGTGAAVSISGIHFQTNGNFCLNISGSDGQLTLTNCFINATNATAINVAAGNLINIHIHYCLCISTATFALIASASVANIQINFCELTGSNPGVSTFTSGALFLNNTVCLHPLQTSGSATTLIVSNCRFANVSTFSQAPITHNSTIAGCSIVNSIIGSGAQPCISIGAGATLTVANMVLSSSATNVTTGAGTMRYANIVYLASTGNNVTTSTALTKFN